MSDAWEEIQAIKNKRNSLRERLEKRRKERQDILGTVATTFAASAEIVTGEGIVPKLEPGTVVKEELNVWSDNLDVEVKYDPELEKELLKALSEVTLQIPISSLDLVTTLNRHVSHDAVCNLLQKFATQKLICAKDALKDNKIIVEVSYVEHTKLNAMVTQVSERTGKLVAVKEENLKRKREESPDKCAEDEDKKKKDPKAADIFVRLLKELKYLIV